MAITLKRVACFLAAVPAICCSAVQASGSWDDSEKNISQSEKVSDDRSWAVSALQFILEKRPDILRKSAFSIIIPSGREELNPVLRLEWEPISAAYAFSEEEGNKLEIKIPSASITVRGIQIAFLKNFGIVAALRCITDKSCSFRASAELEQLSAAGLMMPELGVVQSTAIKINADNINLKAFMKDVCRDETEPDLVTLADVLGCLGRSSNAMKAAYLIGTDFSLTAKADADVGGRLLDFSWKTEFSENKPSDNGKYVLSRSQTLALLKLDKDFLKLVPERQRKPVLNFLENLDKNSGDKYSVKLFCRGLECNLNGKSAKDSFSPIVTANAKTMFSEVSTATAAVKQQVELCVFDQGSENIEHCTTGYKATDFEGGRGWNLTTVPQDYATKYLESIEVKNGVITATARNNGTLKGETIIYVPKIGDNDTVYWVIDEKSTCLSAGFCQSTD